MCRSVRKRGGGGCAIRIGSIIAGLTLTLASPVCAQDADPERDLQVIEPIAVPEEVERIVRFRALGFGQDRRFGGSVEVAALFDSNINRATRADALGPVMSDVVPPAFVAIGDLLPGLSPGLPIAPGVPGGTIPELDNGARSDIGVSLRGQAYVRHPIDNDSDLLIRASTSGQFYDKSQFSDLVLSLQAGPEYAVGIDRIAVFAGPVWRWYGSRPYSLALGGGISWQHPLDRDTQLRIEASAARVDNRRDPQLDGGSYSLTAELDRALSHTAGMGAQVTVQRETAREPGFSTTGATLTVHAFRQIGPATVIATFGYGRLEADRSLFFFDRRRIDDRFTASLTGTLPALRIGPVAPLARLTWERNRSTLGYYDFRRVAGEVGLVAVF